MNGVFLLLVASVTLEAVPPPYRVVVSNTQAFATFDSPVLETAMAQDTLFALSQSGQGITLRAGSPGLPFSLNPQIGAHFSPNGRYLFRYLGVNSAEILDLDTQKRVANVPEWSRARTVSFSPNGSVAAAVFCRTGDKKGWLQIVSTETGGQVSILSYHCGLTAPTYSPSSSQWQAIAYRTAEDTIRVFPIGLAKAEMPRSYGVAGAQYIVFSPDGKYIAVATESKTTVLIESTTGSTHSIDGGANRLVFSPDGRTLARLTREGNIGMIDLKSHAEKFSFALPGIPNATGAPGSNGPPEVLVFSKDSAQMLIYSPRQSKVLFVFEAESGKEIGSIAFSNPIWDTGFSLDGKSIRVLTVSSRQVFWSKVSKNFSQTAELEPVSESVPFDPIVVPEIVIPPPLTGPALDEELARLCQLPYDEKLWNELNADPKASDRILSLRLQKPGAFTSKSDLKELGPFLESHSQSRLAILGNILAYSHPLYEQLIDKAPQWKEMAKLPLATCRTPSEERQIHQGVLVYLRGLMQATRGRGDFETWSRLRPFREYIKADLSSEIRKSFVFDIANFLTDETMKGYLYVIGRSKLHRLAQEMLAPLFMLEDSPSEGHTDLVPVRDGYSMRLFVVGTQEIDRDPLTRTPYGFFAKELPATPLLLSRHNSHDPIHVEWTHGRDSFRASLKLELLPNLKTEPQSDSQSAALFSKISRSLWNDEKLVGIAFAGTNLKGLQEKIMDQFRDYYTQSGFVFDSPGEVLDDVESFLQEKVISGELDYLIKEAHGGGDLMNIGRLNHRGIVKKGMKWLGDGRRELIYLIYPPIHPVFNETSFLLSLRKFSEWLRWRHRNGASPLVYVNGSCWSDLNIQNLIALSNLESVWPVASTTSVLPFSNNPTNAERLWLDAFRSGKSNTEIRSAMKRNNDYLIGSGNRLISPDEPIYLKRILDPLNRVPISFDLIIQNANGESYEAD